LGPNNSTTLTRAVVEPSLLAHSTTIVSSKESSLVHAFS
jgi:hypothetical protein